jgi:hypothetical protein
VQLRFLLVTGPNSEPATVEFGAGLNVVYGGSNTGKSHILRLIDYALGAKSPPEPIAEQAGYDLVHLGIEHANGKQVTYVRALQGGDIRVLDGLVRYRPSKGQGTAVGATHSAKNSLSKMLLEMLGAEGKRIRTDAAGKTRDLSYRDLERHALVDETKIQDVQSPILSGQYVTKTAETSVFKFLLTGVDDEALDIAKPDPNQPLKQAAQLELLDRQIRDLDRQISEQDQDHDHEELFKLETALDEELDRTFRLQEETEITYRQLSGRRRDMRQRYVSYQDRLDEIDTLKGRFALLAEHYASDEKRLAAIIEAGGLFVLEDGVSCPICGAEAGHHRPDKACDGNVSDIVAAATAEIAELQGRAADLAVTVQGLTAERAGIEKTIEDLGPQLDSVQSEILREVPSVQSMRMQTSSVMQRKLSVQKTLDVVRRRVALEAERAELGVSPGYDSSTIVAQQQLDGSVLDGLCQTIEAELKAWQFPSAQRVFFELQKMDISVGGKSRSANGKGVRALLHGAFSVGLMKFCSARSRAHPGFLVLDSLFITYKDPSDLEDAQIATTPLKDRAFQEFANLPASLQLIVLENVDVPDWLASQPNCVHFTGQPSVGRPGLFPSLAGTKQP